MTAMLLKLDALIRAVDGARNHFAQLEEMSDEDLARLEVEFQRLRRVATQRR
jgi:low affinity Fe/Cu permease